MTRQEFLDLLDRESATIRRINETKGHDYAGDEDALSNFKDEAAEIGITPEQVWHVYAAKHWRSVATYVREGEVQSEPIEGRLRDVILYCFLLMGLVEEKRELKQETYLEPGSRAGSGDSGWLDLGATRPDAALDQPS